MRRTLLPILVLVAMFLGAFLVVRLPVTAAQEATPAGTECPTTTADENKALVSQLYEALSANDEAAVATLMAADVGHNTPAGDTRTGSPEEFFTGQRVNFPEATVTVDLLMAEGDMVAAYTTWSGTFQGDTAVFFGNALDIPEAGLTSDWVSAVFFRIECGKVSEVWPVTHRHHQLRHLGVITEDELQSVHAPATPAP
ncbi:MAG: ester cyclase [Thermomicrobiales bacterium]|nr:ester cyclase [Thermomicrobiales bacterium]